MGTVSVDVERSIQGDTGQTPGRTSAPKRKTVHALSLAARLPGEHRKRRQNKKKGGGNRARAEESEWGYPVAVTVDNPKGERHTSERDRRATVSYLMDN